MFPVYYPALGSRCHMSSKETSIRKIEITRIAAPYEGWKTVQEAWLGSGNRELNKQRRSASVLQCHFGLLPKERDRMFVIVFLSPSMCIVVSVEVYLSFSRRAKAQISCPATSEPELLSTSLVPHQTVGWLFLNSAT